MDKIIAFTDTTGKKRKGRLVICPICDKEFPTRLDQVRVYCSTKCSYKARRKRVVVTCAWCGKEFERTPAQTRLNKHGYQFCSRKCKDAAQRLDGITAIHSSHFGRGNGRYAYRKIAYDNCLHQCQDCGWNDEPAILEAHHVDGNRDNNVPNNLVLLCPTCHALRHYQTKTGKWKKKS